MLGLLHVSEEAAEVDETGRVRLVELDAAAKPVLEEGLPGLSQAGSPWARGGVAASRYV
jgi:hypothetical protein